MFAFDFCFAGSVFLLFPLGTCQCSFLRPLYQSICKENRASHGHGCFIHQEEKEGHIRMSGDVHLRVVVHFQVYFDVPTAIIFLPRPRAKNLQPISFHKCRMVTLMLRFVLNISLRITSNGLVNAAPAFILAKK